jgi:hypothetical protein
MSFFNHRDDFKNLLLMQSLDRDFVAQFSDVINGHSSDPIIGYDWEGLPLRANAAGLIYLNHLKEEQAGTFIKWKDLIRHFNAKSTISNRIHTMGPGED